jgi:hypothetical protein
MTPRQNFVNRLVQAQDHARYLPRAPSLQHTDTRSGPKTNTWHRLCHPEIPVEPLAVLWRSRQT